MFLSLELYSNLMSRLGHLDWCLYLWSLCPVELVLLWAPVFAEVGRVVVVAVVALFVAWKVVLVAVLHCTVELAIASPCLHEVN